MGAWLLTGVSCPLLEAVGVRLFFGATRWSSPSSRAAEIRGDLESPATLASELCAQVRLIGKDTLPGFPRLRGSLRVGPPAPHPGPSSPPPPPICRYEASGSLGSAKRSPGEAA